MPNITLGKSVLGAVVCLVSALIAGGQSAEAASILPTTSTATYQTNGRVSAVITVGNTTYIGGSFTSVRPAGAAAGTNEEPRKNLAAVDSRTGALRAWNPSADNIVYALAASPDGSTIYVGGTFSTVGGQRHKRVAAVSAAGTGSVTDFRADTNYKVRALTAVADRIYLGGTFTTVNGQPRSRLAAVDSTGQVDTTWVPSANEEIQAIGVSPTSGDVWVGGYFSAINGDAAQSHLAKLDSTTGEPITLASRPTWPVAALVVTASQTFVGGDGPGGNAAAYDPGGKRNWSMHTDGGVQALAMLDGTLYAGGHFDNFCFDNSCSAFTTRHKLVAVDPDTGGLDAWNPGANSALGVFALDADQPEGVLHAGGTFTKIGKRYQQGYGQFG